MIWIFVVISIYYVSLVFWGACSLYTWHLCSWERLKTSALASGLSEEDIEPFRRQDDHVRVMDHPFLWLFGLFVLLPFRLTTIIVLTLLGYPVITFAGLLLPYYNVLNSFLFRLSCQILLRSVVFIIGIVRIEEVPVLGRTEIPRPPYRYIFISNHVSPVDILFFLLRDLATFVAKRSVQNLPFIGYCTKLLDCIYVERSELSERAQALQQILDAQSSRAAQENPLSKFQSMVIFPEGTTSSGQSLLTFKRGAFQGLKPVTPAVLTYKTNYFNPSYEIMHYVAWFALLLLSPGFITLKVQWLPDQQFELTDQNPRNFWRFAEKTRAEMLKVLNPESAKVHTEILSDGIKRSTNNLLLKREIAAFTDSTNCFLRKKPKQE